MQSKAHGDPFFATRPAQALSCYQARAEPSLALVRGAGPHRRGGRGLHPGG
jgi:hypothetical protein